MNETTDQGRFAAALRTVCIAALAWLLLGGHAAWAAPKALVRIEARGDRLAKTLYATNPGPAPVSIKVGFRDLENVSVDRMWPIYAVVPPRAEVYLCRLSSRDRTRRWSYGYRTTATLGAFTAVPDANARYRLPYPEGEAFTIGQAPGGPITTHTTPESAYAIDIDMPEGTPVLAARDGVVIEAVDRYKAGGPDRALLTRANRVRVLHADGTIAEYAHLKPGGAAARVGEAVKAGKVIGYSGATGYAYGPHLHFAVTRVTLREGTFKLVSEPIVFYNGKPPATFSALTGMQVRANYSGPVEKARAASGERGSNVSSGSGQPARRLEMPAAVTAFLGKWWWSVTLAIPVIWAGLLVLRIFRDKEDDTL